MKRTFRATTWREDDWWVAQCLEVDVASQGRTERESLAHLDEALELYFQPPVANPLPRIHSLAVETGG